MNGATTNSKVLTLHIEDKEYELQRFDAQQYSLRREGEHVAILTRQEAIDLLFGKESQEGAQP